jgi:hypothetical protein
LLSMCGNGGRSLVILSRSEGSRTMGNEILRSTLRMTLDADSSLLP